MTVKGISVIRYIGVINYVEMCASLRVEIGELQEQLFRQKEDSDSQALVYEVGEY